MKKSIELSEQEIITLQRALDYQVQISMDELNIGIKNRSYTDSEFEAKKKHLLREVKLYNKMYALRSKR
jgi:hypothetical protein